MLKATVTGRFLTWCDGSVGSTRRDRVRHRPMRVVGRGELEKAKKTTKKLENSYMPLALHKTRDKTEFKHFQQSQSVCNGSDASS